MLQFNGKEVLCVRWKGIRLEKSPVREVCALGDILAGCALKFDVCIMAVSKGVVIVSGGLIWLSVQVEQCGE